MNESQALLESVATRPAAVEWFRGLFDRVHLEITDTGEQFTIDYAASGAKVAPGFQGDDPNFVVPATSDDLRRLSEVFADDQVDADEEFRIVRAMLKPCLQAALEMPILRSDAIRRIVQVDNHWQEALLDPNGDEVEPVTAFHVNGQWVVVPGYHGVPQRRLLLTAAQALEFQRRLFAADQRNSLPGWVDFARWYREWRESVTAPLT